MTPVEALQAALAGEHAALYVYDVLGGQVAASAQPTLAANLTAAYVAHRSQRDELTALVAAHGVEPVAAEPAYTLPNMAATAAEQAAAALQVEQRCAILYGQLVANSVTATRRRAIAMLTACAVRQLQFGGRPQEFPGYRA